MPTVNKITSTLFDQIKTELEHVSPLVVAQANHLSMKTILMVKGSETFADYENQKIAQHPKPKRPPVAEALADINLKLDQILGLARQNRLL